MPAEWADYRVALWLKQRDCLDSEYLVFVRLVITDPRHPQSALERRIDTLGWQMPYKLQS